MNATADANKIVVRIRVSIGLRLPRGGGRDSRSSRTSDESIPLPQQTRPLSTLSLWHASHRHTRPARRACERRDTAPTASTATNGRRPREMMRALTKRLLRIAFLESVHVSAHVIYAMLAQEALDPFVERQSVSDRQGFPVTLEFYLKRSIQHQTLSASGQVMHERGGGPSLSRRKTTSAFLFRSNNMSRLKPRCDARGLDPADVDS